MWQVLFLPLLLFYTSSSPPKTSRITGATIFQRLHQLYLQLFDYTRGELLQAHRPNSKTAYIKQQDVMGFTSRITSVLQKQISHNPTSSCHDSQIEKTLPFSSGKIKMIRSTVSSPEKLRLFIGCSRSWYNVCANCHL